MGRSNNIARYATLKSGRIVSILALCAGLSFAQSAIARVPQQASSTVAGQGGKLANVYDLVAATPFTYSPNEIEQFGQNATTLSGNARLYALWRVLYAYKTSQDETRLQAWHNRIAALAQSDRDSNLDLLARFMYQAYQNEAGGYEGLSEREWHTYQAAPNRAIQNIVMLERERELQYAGKWAEAIDLGDKLVVRLQAEGQPAEPLLNAAQQTLAYNMLKVGDYDGYAEHMLAVARLSRRNAFFQQKMDMVYDLAFFAAQDNNIALAKPLQKLYAANVARYKIAELQPWDRQLCATVGDKAGNSAAVVDCLKDSPVARGEAATPHDAFQLMMLTKAHARLFHEGVTRFYYAKLRGLPETVYRQDPLFNAYVEAYLKAGDGFNAEAFQDLGDLTLAMQRAAEVKRVASVQDMYKALRKELDSKTAESRLLNRQVELGQWLFGAAALIAVLLSVIIAGGTMWVIRMRRMQWRLKDAHEHAQAANAAKSRFLAVMSHELRTPLNGVLGMAQTLRKGQLNEQQRGQVDILVESGETLMVLLNDVLDMSRIEAGKVELAPTPSSMKDMIERVINTYAPTIEDKPLVLRYDLDDSASQIMSFDVLRVYQCLSNLVSNATKFTERGTVRILASAEKAEDQPGYVVRVEVHDSGIGMSKATLGRLFEAYAQADAGTARKYGGSGLGLSISRRLTELMGGTLSVTSDEGHGSTFVMTFKAGEVVQAAPKMTVRSEAPAATPASHGHRILLVDDHPVNRKVARLFLEPFGFDITEAADGQEALDAGMEDYDLVLMDVNMPRLGGLDATRMFRANEETGKHVPIVALTADAMPEQVEACLAAGMDAHISKPILMDKLIETVTGLLHVDAPEGTAPVAKAV